MVNILISFLKKTRVFAFSFLLLINASGCVFVAGGVAGAIGGYMVTRDTIGGEYRVHYEDAWKASVNACKALGKVSKEDYNEGIILAAVDKADIKVVIKEIVEKSVSIKVKARKGLFPQAGTAEKVFIKIAQKLIR